jgi:hypothetical protein
LTGARKAEFAASRRSLGVRERTFLQHTPQGDLVLVTLEGDHPETAFAEFGKRTDPFTMWFKQQVSEIHGMDLSAPPPGPMPQQVIDSHPDDEDAPVNCYGPVKHRQRPRPATSKGGRRSACPARTFRGSRACRRSRVV